MNPPQASYFRHLDGVRAIAVLMVVVHHWYEHPSFLHLAGARGVAMFFVLSGFLITNILFQQQAAFQSGMSGIRTRILGTFYMRRTLRIFPIYYLYVGVLVLLGVGQAREIWIWLFGYAYNFLLFLTNQWHSGYVEHLWSLAIEEQYYLIWPILLLSCPPRYNHILIGAFILLGMTTKAALYLHEPASQFTKFPVCQFDSFGLGSALALAWRRGIRIPYAAVWMWIFWAASVTIPLKIFHFHGLSLLGQVIPLFSIGSAFFIYLAAKGFEGASRYFFDHPWIIYLGKISYGIYLYHLFVPDLVKWCILRSGMALPPSAVLWGFYSALTLGICSLSWFLIEQPVNRLKDRFTYRKTA